MASEYFAITLSAYDPPRRVIAKQPRGREAARVHRYADALRSIFGGAVSLYFTFVGTIADVDEATADNPSFVLVVDLDGGDGMERVVLPESVWRGPRELLGVGRRVRVGGKRDLAPKPGALPVADHFEFIDVH